MLSIQTLTLVLSTLYLASAADTNNPYATYPSVAHTASINGFADKIYGSLPSCAHPCVKEDTGSTPCPYWDAGCLCVMQNWAGEVANCIAENCKGKEVETATNLATSICSSAGVWSPYWMIPSSASEALAKAAKATTTAEASSSSTSEAKAPSSSTSVSATSSSAPEQSSFADNQGSKVTSAATSSALTSAAASSSGEPSAESRSPTSSAESSSAESSAASSSAESQGSSASSEQEAKSSASAAQSSESKPDVASSSSASSSSSTVVSQQENVAAAGFKASTAVVIALNAGLIGVLNL
ncbi:Piso0_005779 [Millerozyma farinosa CBS 7064]|uniref:Piso0_005779 protein n=1 Tax=Pichia sorbitophila (strain ATCC MYA-4447 / BCRC 22081 / CBS 7064 / NBRC 10061 / NRRL Y-12695) TaxID=559304 RepID=G8Y2W8_PICSO|nr:Piso0_005779 [Millerozyma farinosa CBS 7064]